MGARRFLPLLVVVVLAGCGGGAAVNRAPEAPTCETRHPAKNPSDTLTVVLFDKVDLSHAPWGRNREERFVFSHLYETLVTVDCHGKIQPALAKSIQEGSDGWLIELRDDARFWDDEPVSSFEVAESFKTAIRNGLAIKSVVAIDERTVLVQGYDGRPDPKLLTLPMASITKPGTFTALASDGGYSVVVPMGTGAWAIDETMPVVEAIVIRPVDAIAPIIRFVQGNVSDARDLMDGAADAMITDDPAAIDYARKKQAVALAPLAWDNVYVLLSGSRERHVSQRKHVNALSQSLCESLARDAVDVDARGGSTILNASKEAVSPLIRRDYSELPRRTSLWLSAQIVYPRNDPTARQLTERLVALASSDTSSSPDARAVTMAIPDIPDGLKAIGLDERAFTKALVKGQEFAYVLPISWNADFPNVAWSLRDAGAHFLFSLSDELKSEAVVPLIETRAHFIALSARIGYMDDHNGNVRIQPVHVGGKR